LEKRRIVDQRRGEVREALASLAHLLCRQGSVVAKRRRRGGCEYGPFFFVAYRDEAGKQRSIYVGAEGKFVEEIRQALADLQAPLRDKRRLIRVRKMLAHNLRGAHGALDRELASLLLWRKGSEVRGWNETTLRP
jgi:hypothetical protein